MSEHPLVEAVGPLLRRVGGRLVDAADAVPGDVPLLWDGVAVAHVRLGEPADPGPGGLEQLIAEVEDEVGRGPLADLSREHKQQVVRVLEERGAFEFRRSAEQVAEAIGVSRFTVYNYLNRAR